MIRSSKKPLRYLRQMPIFSCFITECFPFVWKLERICLHPLGTLSCCKRATLALPLLRPNMANIFWVIPQSLELIQNYWLSFQKRWLMISGRKMVMTVRSPPAPEWLMWNSCWLSTFLLSPNGFIMIHFYHCAKRGRNGPLCLVCCLKSILLE